MYEHDYDGSLAKAGKRHLGKTRWTREEVHTGLNNSKPAVQYKIFNTANIIKRIGLRRDHFPRNLGTFRFYCLV